MPSLRSWILEFFPGFGCEGLRFREGFRAESYSSCSEERSPMKRFPDPKQFYNNWKNDMSLFPATNQKRPLFRAAATLPSAQLARWFERVEKRIRNENVHESFWLVCHDRCHYCQMTVMNGCIFGFSFITCILKLGTKHSSREDLTKTGNDLGGQEKRKKIRLKHCFHISFCSSPPHLSFY